MTKMALLQWLVYITAVLLCVRPLGTYMALVYQHRPCGLHIFLEPFEKAIYWLCGIQTNREMDWKNYLAAFLIFNCLGMFLVYAILRLQNWLPLNPEQFAAIPSDLAFNTAISFTSNTNWQAYAGEASMSYFSQMIAFTLQNFLSAASGMALVVAFIRGFNRTESKELGNFWVDVIRTILYILLPLSLILSLILISQGVIQNFKNYQNISLVQAFSNQSLDSNQASITEQILPMGPVASQVAIKQLGSNGGGFFNTNAAHPYENPNAISNFFEMLAILLIPSSLCYTFGILVQDRRQGVAILVAMLLLFIPLQLSNIYFEQQANPLLQDLPIDSKPYPGMSAGGNMEGKETRFGINSSALWASSTTASSNGSVNAMLDSFTPLGGMIPLIYMHLGEVVFGGVGSGLYSMLIFVILAVFIAGLMVGRTPEYLGKKIEAFEMKMASFAVLVMPLIVLIMTAIAILSKMGVEAILNTGPHGFSEILYAFTSMVNNNGSAFAGLNANTPFYNILGGMVMLIGRYWLAIPALAIAGSLVQKKTVPITLGTLQTHSPLFIILLVSIILILGALSFFPALVLGPIAEHLMLWSKHGNF